MVKLARPAKKPPAENTIALINIVFLMLIFFLIAGSLTPPMEKSVQLIKAQMGEPLAPPRALFITQEGALKYAGEAITPEQFVTIKREEHTTVSSLDLRVVADQALPAVKLIEIIDLLKAAGADKVSVITERKQP